MKALHYLPAISLLCIAVICFSGFVPAKWESQPVCGDELGDGGSLSLEGAANALQDQNATAEFEYIGGISKDCCGSATELMPDSAISEGYPNDDVLPDDGELLYDFGLADGEKLVYDFGLADGSILDYVFELAGTGGAFYGRDTFSVPNC